MALQDILDAIKTEADERIATARTQHHANMKAMRDASEQLLARKRQLLKEQKEQKMRHIKEKAESHARMLRNKTLLARKQECMQKLYDQVLKDLVTLPKDKTESLLRQCLSVIKEKGVVYPAAPHEALLKKLLPDGCEMGKPTSASGGFRFASSKKEYDFTYEFMVENIILPQSEVRVAGDLFPSAS